MSEEHPLVNAPDIETFRALLHKKYPTLKPSYATMEREIDGGIGWENIPAPGVLHFAYCNVLEFPSSRPWEKTAWEIYGEAYGRHFRVAHTKFGARLFVETPYDDSEVTKIRDMQFRLVKETTKYLARLKKKMIAEGRVTVENKAIALFGEYEYFKETAFEKYKEDPPEPVLVKADADKRFESWRCDPFKPAREGNYHAKHSLYSFFSWLKHVLLLLYPFSRNYDSSRLSTFLGLKWGDKWVTVFDSKDKKASKALNILRRIANEYRNYFGHGEIRNGGESFAFHIPGAGAVPFLEPSGDLDFFWTDRRILELRFKAIVEQLDEAINLMNESQLGLAMEFVMSGVSVAFDEKSRQSYLEAQKDEDAMERLIDKMAYLECMYANMDF